MLDGVGSGERRWKHVLTELDSIENQVEQAISLATAEKNVADIPGEITKRADLDRGDELAAEARSGLQSVPEAVSPDVEALRERVEKRLGEAEHRLDRGRVEVRFQDANAALGKNDPRTAGIVLLDASRILDHLDPPPSGQDLRERFDQLSERRRQVLVEMRREAGWITLPAPAAPQVPSTPENRRLRLLMLIDAPRLQSLQQAESLAAEEGLADDPELLRRIRFARAVWHEDNGDLEQAYRHYKDLYEDEELCSADSEEPVCVAAGAALARLDARFQRDRDESRSQQRLLVTVAAAACLVVVVLVRWRRATRSGRVAAIRQYLRKADRALNKDAGPDADAYLRRAAELMAGLPPDDPRVRDLEQQLAQQANRHQAVAAVSKNRVRPEQPDVANEVRRIVADGRPPTEDAASYCLRWLRERRANRASRKLRPKVGDWLYRKLKPEKHFDDDELAWRARLAEQCEQLAPKLAWPFLYQVRAHYWRSDHEAAIRVAGRWESKRLRPSEASEVLIILGKSYVALKRWKDAFETFRKLLERKGAPSQARDWAHFAWTQRQIEQKARIGQDDLNRVIASLVGSGASRERPNE